MSHLRNQINRSVLDLREVATNLEDVEQGALALEATLERREKLLKEADAALEAANFKLANCGDQIRALEEKLRDTASQLEKANTQNLNQKKVIQSVKNLLPDWEIDPKRWELVPSNPNSAVVDMDWEQLRSKYLVSLTEIGALKTEVNRLKSKLEQVSFVARED